MGESGLPLSLGHCAGEGRAPLVLCIAFTTTRQCVCVHSLLGALHENVRATGQECCPRVLLRDGEQAWSNDFSGVSGLRAPWIGPALSAHWLQGLGSPCCTWRQPKRGKRTHGMSCHGKMGKMRSCVKTLGRDKQEGFWHFLLQPMWSVCRFTLCHFL